MKNKISFLFILMVIAFIFHYYYRPFIYKNHIFDYHLSDFFPSLISVPGLYAFQLLVFEIRKKEQMKLNLEDINKAFESKARLGIMSVLLVNESIDFVSLKNLLELTDGNLASHTRNLEELGYIRSYKQFIGRKPNTTFSVTPEGKEAFKKHLNALENFLKNQLE